MPKPKLATSDPIGIQKDTDKLVRFLSMYCNAHHGHRLRKSFVFDHARVSAKVLNGPELCDECSRLLRHAIIMARIHARRVHFGEAEWESDVDAVIPHRGVLEKMLEGRDPRSS